MTSLFPPDDVKVYGIAELTRAVKDLLEDAFAPCVWVSGEVSTLNKHASGHWYLTLKDRESKLAATMFRGANLRVRFDLQVGMEVIARGRLTVYPPQGSYQLQIEELQPKGVGPLELAFRQLKERLSRLGYFDPRRRKPLPRYPRRVALVTSPSGAAIRDLLETLGRRWPLTEIWLYPTAVQGDEAAAAIAAAIRTLNTLPDIDVMIIGRGGGSLEDLWAFNEECVAEAVFNSRIPVVSGVGHETDLVISDMVADLRALTPTDAANKVVPDRLEIQAWLEETEQRLRTLLHQQLEQAQQRIGDLARRRCFRLPVERIQDLERRLDERADRLARSVRQRLGEWQRQLEAQAAQLETLSPLNVLARGYSLTRTELGQNVVRAADQVRPGDRLVTLLAKGRVISRVEEIEDGGRQAEPALP